MPLDDTAVVLVAAPQAARRLRLCAVLGRAGVVGLPARDPVDAVGKLDRYPEVTLVLVDEGMPCLAGMLTQLRQRRPGLDFVGIGRREAFAGLGLRRVLADPEGLALLVAPRPPARPLSVGA